MLALQLAQTMKAQVAAAKEARPFPNALRVAMDQAPEAFLGQTPDTVLATFEAAFPQAVEDVVTDRILAHAQAGFVPHLTVADLRSILAKVFGHTGLDNHATLFANLVFARITTAFGLRAEKAWTNRLGDVWILERPTIPQDHGCGMDTSDADHRAFLAQLSQPVDPSGWHTMLAAIDATSNPAEKALLSDDLFRSISAFACPLRASHAIHSSLTFQDMIHLALLRAHIRAGVVAWINSLSDDAPLHRFQTHCLSIPAALQAIAARMHAFQHDVEDSFMDTMRTLNIELDELVGAWAELGIDVEKGLLSVRLYAPSRHFKNTRNTKKPTGVLEKKLRLVTEIQKTTRWNLRLNDLESLLTDAERSAVDTAIAALAASVLSDNPTQGVAFGAPYAWIKRGLVTPDGIFVPISLDRILREVILLRTGLQCISSARDDGLITNVCPACDPDLAMTQAGYDLIVAQAAALNAL